MKWLSETNDPELVMAYSRLLSFSADDIHASWLDTLKINDYLKKHPIVTRKNTSLNRLILSELNISNASSLVLNKPIDPLLLMTKNSLLKLLNLLGAIQFQKDICHTILSAELAYLKSDIGLEIYEFAINIARLYSLPSLANKKNIIQTFKTQPLKALQCAGAETLFKVIERPDDIIFSYTKYKLPTHVAEYMSTKHIIEYNIENKNEVRNKALKIAKDNRIECYHLLA
jgi:hypothetical protein